MNLKISNTIKLLVSILYCMTMFVATYAQNTKYFHPIEVDKKLFSTKYYYDGQSFESPYGLQIPILELNNTEVTSLYNSYKKSRKVAKIINLISSGFSLYSFFNRDKMPPGAYWSALGTAGLVSAFFNIKADVKLNKAIKGYNKIVSNSKLGFDYDKTEFGQHVFNIGVVHKF